MNSYLNVSWQLGKKKQIQNKDEKVLIIQEKIVEL